MTLRPTLVSTSELPQILPGLLSGLSIARGQIVLEQLQSAVRNQASDDIIVVTLSETESSKSVAAAIALHDRSSSPGVRSLPESSRARDQSQHDSANLLHAGPYAEPFREFDSGDLAALSQTLDRALAQRGVQFVQWATDIPANNGDELPRWCQGFGFTPVAQLHYLSCPISDAIMPVVQRSDEVRLRFVPLDWGAGQNAVGEFSSLLQQTYVETMDCPLLTQFRTAIQTIDAYQRTASFAASLWFTLENKDGQNVGCLILAEHVSTSTSDSPGDSGASESVQAEKVIELVYMGLVASARGKGRGRQLLGKTFSIAADRGAARVILAVDESNTPASALYNKAGLTSVMREAVWVKALGEAQSR